MKKKLTFFLLFSSFALAFAIPLVPFQGWDWTMEKSSDVVVARCDKTSSMAYKDGEVYTDIQVVSVLKGTNGSGPAMLRSTYWPKQGEWYLIFSDYHDGSHQAFEDYRIVPLGVEFSTNVITGKTLAEKIQSLFKYRLSNLEREMQKSAEEKKRLEAFQAR